MSVSKADAAKYLKEAKKEIQRIKRFVREAEKRGFVFSDNVIPDLPKGQADAGTVRKYQKITPESLYKKAVYIDNGKRVKGTTRRKQERKAAAKKAAETRKINRAMKVLKRVREIIEQWTPNPSWPEYLKTEKERDKNQLENLLNGAIAQFGENAVAKRMEEQSLEIYDLVFAIIYGDSKGAIAGRAGVQMNLAKFAAIINGRPLTIKESKEYTEYGESDEYEDEEEEE